MVLEPLTGISDLRATSKWLALPFMGMILMPWVGWSAALPGIRVCIDDVGHRAACTADDGTSIRGRATGVHYQDECRASDHLGRCPTDPMCFKGKGEPTLCVGTVVFATAQCGDGSVTASGTPQQACAAHSGVFINFHSAICQIDAVVIPTGPAMSCTALDQEKAQKPIPITDKSFLLLFFKKEGLALPSIRELHADIKRARLRMRGAFQIRAAGGQQGPVFCHLVDQAEGEAC